MTAAHKRLHAVLPISCNPCVQRTLADARFPWYLRHCLPAHYTFAYLNLVILIIRINLPHFFKTHLSFLLYCVFYVSVKRGYGSMWLCLRCQLNFFSPSPRSWQPTLPSQIYHLWPYHPHGFAHRYGSMPSIPPISKKAGQERHQHQGYAELQRGYPVANSKNKKPVNLDGMQTSHYSI